MSDPSISRAPASLRARRGARLLLLAVGLAGAGTMVVELAAVRLLAPWFGSSNAVWTHAIGVILLALALGYALGARWSLRGQPLRAMVRVLLGSAAWCVLLPWMTPHVASWFMPDGVTLHGAAGLLFWGSLASSVILFLIPALLLGCVAPMAVEALAGQRPEPNGAPDSALDPGQAGGYVLALSTLGSLVGTFATTYWLVPGLGLRWTFGLASGLLAFAAVLLAWRVQRIPALGMFLAILGAASQMQEPLRSSPQGTRVLAQTQSAYQWLRVVEVGEGATRQRRLIANEAFDSFQSLWKPQPGWLGDGSYYDYFVAPTYWEAPRDEWRVLVLGLGAGTALRVLEGTLPSETALFSTGIEIDPEVVRLGKEFFDLESNDTDRLVWSGIDARAGLRGLPRDFDQIIVDAYANNVEIPPHLSTLEFFREARSHLRPGGWLSVNLSGFGAEDPVIQAVSGTIAAAFESNALLCRLPFSRNAMLFARVDQAIPDPGQVSEFVRGPAPLRERLLDLRLTSRWIAPASTGILTDDHAPILELQRASVERGVRGWLEATE